MYALIIWPHGRSSRAEESRYDKARSYFNLSSLKYYQGHQGLPQLQTSYKRYWQHLSSGASVTGRRLLYF